MHPIRIIAACAMMLGSTAIASEPNTDITKESSVDVIALHYPNAGSSMCWVTTSITSVSEFGTNWNMSFTSSISISPGATVLVARGHGKDIQKLASYVGVDDYTKCIRT